MTQEVPTPEADDQVADAPQGNWVDRFAPPISRPYLRLSRADRPIGTWLLLIPCLWGDLLAAAGRGWIGSHDLLIIASCAVGAFLMRGAGCTWNDITDRDIDGKVARTRSRPIPSGQVTVKQALAWMILQAFCAFAILLSMYPLAIKLGVASLALVAIYPFAKRFTWWPQVFLGLAFNWGALLAYAASTDKLTPAAFALYASGIAWTLFYDTIYAHQDKEDDALIGVHSTARLFGNQTRKWLQAFMILTVLLMGLAVLLETLPSKNVLALVIGLSGVWGLGWHLAWQLRNLNTDDPASCLKVFRSNRNAGLIPALFLAAATIV
jgi:4-hydroxybenzoate polyprenyltransferase